MSKSQSKIPSPSRSLGVITPRRPRTRRTHSTASPARSEGSGRLSYVVEKFVKEDSVLSPLKKRSMLPDDTEIEAPRRASWWKRLDGSSRDVLEALDTNKMTDDLQVEEYEFEVEKDKQNQSVPESSDNESVASIVVPQRKLFNQNKQPQGKFADIMGSRKSLGQTNIEDQSIEDAPKNLFKKGPRNKPVFPAALLNSTNKTINKTVEPEAPKQSRPILFGQAGTKRKNMFTDFVASDSEEDSEVQHKVFGFNKNKRISLGTRNRRMPSLTPSVTTDIDIDDWNLLPSSTMIGAQEVSRMSTDEVEQVQEGNQDATLTEINMSFNCDSNKRSNENRVIENDENDKTLTNEDIREPSHQKLKMNESMKTSNMNDRSKTKLNESVKDKTLQNKSSTRANAENEEVIKELVIEKLQNNAATKNQITEMNEQSLEDKMAEIHGESVGIEKSRQKIQLDKTKDNLNNYNDTESIQEIQPGVEEQKVKEASKPANNAAQNKDDVLPKKDKSEEELEQIIEAQRSENLSKEASTLNQDGNVNDKSKKDKSESQTNVGDQEQRSEGHSKDASNTNHAEDMENESEEESEPSAEEQGTRDHSEEAGGKTNQDEDINSMSEKDKSEEEIEPSDYDEKNQHESNEVSNENEDEAMDDESEKDKSEEEIYPNDRDEENQHESNEDEEMEDVSEKDKSEEKIEPSIHREENKHESDKVGHENADVQMDDVSNHDKVEEIETSANTDHEDQNGSKEEIHENQDEDMEKMVWNDNDDEKAGDDLEAEIDPETKQNNKKGYESRKNDRTFDRKETTNKSKKITNKSQKIVESSVDNDQMEEVIDETPNNSTHGTEVRSRKRETIVKSPEQAVLKNITIDNESFRPIGRSTTFRNSKSVYEMMNRPSLAPVQESTLGSEGSRNSSTEGSEWDSHRTTRKTIRQTLGKEYTTRKSLRALVMEQSAKRQTELYNKNTSNINKTKNKSVIERNNKNTSKLNITKNKSKTVLEDANNTETIEKTKNKTVSEDKNASKINITKTILEGAINKNAAVNKNKTVLDDENDHLFRDITSDRNLLSNQSPISKFPVHGTSTHHVPDTIIPQHQISYLKTLHDIKDPDILDQISNREDSINIPNNNDSGPEISMNASYGQGMSADTAHEASAEENEDSDEEMSNSAYKEIKEIRHRSTSVRSRSIRYSEQEVLDYEALELEKTEQDISESEVDEGNLEDDYMQESVQEEKDNPELEESEQENEDSQQEIEAESEEEERQQEIAESEHEESQQEIESDKEESQQAIQTDHEGSQQDIAESEHEESQQEIESEPEESQQEIESESETENQQEIESEVEESQQEIEPEYDRESENEQDNDSQPETDQESEQETREPEIDSEDEFVSIRNSQHHDNRTGVSRVVFDSQMMSVDEINFEGVSRHTDNDSTKQSVRESEISRNTRVSELSAHEVSLETRIALINMQMDKIAQQNMERRQKVREQVQKSIQANRNRNVSSPQPVYSIRRITKEPKKPKKPKPLTTLFAIEKLPKAFVADLQYKPPRRFQPANAPWITKRLYKFLETKLEPKYDYRARVRAEEFVQSIYSFSKLVRRRRDVAPPEAIDQLKREMAKLRIVNTHHDFYEFFHEFMPREVRLKVNPDLFNKIPVPRDVFGPILPSRTEIN